MKEVVKMVISEEEIATQVKNVALKIEREHPEVSIVLIGILKGSFVFMADLVRQLSPSMKVDMDFMQVSSYGDETESSGEVKIDKDITIDIQGRYVILVEDIVDTGLTIAKVIQHLSKQNPETIDICTLLDKPERRKTGLKIAYPVFRISNQFVVGYGLDYAQNYRHLPFIGVLSFEDDEK